MKAEEFTNLVAAMTMDGENGHDRTPAGAILALNEIIATARKVKRDAAPGLTVHDLQSDKSITFDGLTDPTYAARYCHVTEDQPALASWFFAAIQDRRQDEIELKLPVTKTATAVCCGNWATKL